VFKLYYLASVIVLSLVGYFILPPVIQDFSREVTTTILVLDVIIIGNFLAYGAFLVGTVIFRLWKW
jgi:hypothetical protein